MNRRRKRNETFRPREAGSGFTLIELLVVVGIIAVLIAIFVPSLTRARQQAYQVKCGANLHSIGFGILYFAEDHRDRLPWLTQATWVAQVLPYTKIHRRKAGSRKGLLACPADDNPPFMQLTMPSGDRTATGLFGGAYSTEEDKGRADSGQWAGSPGVSRRGRNGGGAGPGTPQSAPLIEPISYAVSVQNSWGKLDRGPNGDLGRSLRKLSQLKRPYCQTLVGEVYNKSNYTFDWRAWSDGTAVTSGDGIDGREAWRHYGGRNSNSNGTNWWFADGHAKWHSVSSMDRLFCCQDFRLQELRDLQTQTCDGPTAGGGRSDVGRR